MVYVVKNRQEQKIEYTFHTYSGQIKMTTDWFSRKVKKIELYDSDNQRISKSEISIETVTKIKNICERFRKIEEKKDYARLGFGLGLLDTVVCSIVLVFGEGGTGSKIMGFAFGGGGFLSTLACAKVWRSSITSAKAIEEEFKEVSYPSRKELNAAALQKLEESLKQQGLEHEVIVA